MDGRTSGDDEEKVRAPIPGRRGVLSDTPLGLPLAASTNPHEVFRDFKKEAERRGNSKLTQGKDLASLFRPPTEIMFPGNFETACHRAKREGKWLLVNILNEEFSSQQLNRDTWSNSALKRFVGKHFIFWQKYKDVEECRAYVIFYEVVAYPHIAVIDPRTRELMLCWGSVVAPDDLLRELKAYCSDHTLAGGPTASAHMTQSAVVDLSEEEQFRRAIAASLGNEDVSEPANDSGKDLTEDEQLELAIRASLSDMNSKAAPSTDTGPVKRKSDSADPSGGSMKRGKTDEIVDLKSPLKSLGERSYVLQARQTDGGILKGKFCPEHTVGHVRDWIDKHRTDSGVSYVLMTTFPRKIYTGASLRNTLEDEGLNRAMLILKPT